MPTRLRCAGAGGGGQRQFASPADVKAYLQQIYRTFGPLTDDVWDDLARHSTVPDPALPGRFRLAYDPRVSATGA